MVIKNSDEIKGSFGEMSLLLNTEKRKNLWKTASRSGLFPAGGGSSFGGKGQTLPRVYAQV